MPKRENPDPAILAERIRCFRLSRAQKRRFVPKIPNKRSVQKSHFSTQKSHLARPKGPVFTRGTQSRSEAEIRPRRTQSRNEAKIRGGRIGARHAEGRAMRPPKRDPCAFVATQVPVRYSTACCSGGGAISSTATSGAVDRATPTATTIPPPSTRVSGLCFPVAAIECL